MNKGIVAILLILVSCTGSQRQTGEKQLNLYIWSNYISEDTLNKFEKRTGIRVVFDTYDSNEALLHKLQSGVADYDVVVPSDYMIRVLSGRKLLDRLDPDRIPNLKNLSPRFSHLPYDPQRQYSIPFLWGTTGIGYNRARINEKIDSWSSLWDPKYRNRISMLDDPRECFASALKWKGYSINTTDRAQLLEAKELLRIQKPLVKMYNSAAFDEVLLSGDVWISHGWSGQLAKAAEKNKDLVYVVPKEGSTIWVDNLAIPSTARHKEEAYSFLNFCLDAAIAAEITNFSGYASTNEAAIPFIRPEILKDPARYPDEETLKRCEFLKDLGETTKFIDEMWTEIKSR